MLTHRPSPQMVGGHCANGKDVGCSQHLHQNELWANGLAFGSLSEQVVGINSKLPDLGIESVVGTLPQQLSAREVAAVLLKAGLSVASVSRALVSSHLCSLNSRTPTVRASLDWWRWEVFKSRWLECQPDTALLSLPGPDSTVTVAPSSHPLAPSACPDQQVQYAQHVLASYLLVDTIMQQAVRIAQKRQAALIVSVEARTGS